MGWTSYPKIRLTLRRRKNKTISGRWRYAYVRGSRKLPSNATQPQIKHARVLSETWWHHFINSRSRRNLKTSRTYKINTKVRACLNRNRSNVTAEYILWRLFSFYKGVVIIAETTTASSASRSSGPYSRGRKPLDHLRHGHWAQPRLWIPFCKLATILAKWYPFLGKHTHT